MTDARTNLVTAAFTASLASGVMIAQQVASRATRDALFLSAYSARALPAMVLTGAALSLLSVLIATRLMERFGPARVAPAAFAVNTALFGVDYLLSHVQPRAAAVVLYLHVALTGATVISIFWSLISERFDPHTNKQYIARIGAGGTAGGIVGGLLAWNASVLLSVRSNLAMMAGMNLLCVVAALRITVRPQVRSVVEPAPQPTLAVLRGSSYLRLLATLIALVALGEALLDWVFNASAAARYRSGNELIRFFAIFHTATASLTFLLQMGFAKRALKKVGPGGTIALLPLTMIIGGTLGWSTPTFARVVGLRAGEAALSNSLFRSGYELFYAPLGSEKKRSTKTVVDVGCDRVGTFLGGGVTMIALYSARDAPIPLLLAMAVGIGVAVLLLSRHLQRGYVAALAESLKSDAEQLARNARIPAFPAVSPRTTPAGALLGPPSSDPGQLGSLPTDNQPANDSPRREGAEFVDDVAALVLREQERAMSVLTRPPLDVRLVAVVIPLLDDDALALPALRALRGVAPRIVGTLGDALLEQEQPADVRRRIPIALRAAPTQRTCHVLLAGLTDPSFEVRYQVGIALVHVRQRSSRLRIDEPSVIEAVVREVEVDQDTWESRLELAPEEDGDDFEFMEAYLRLRTSRGLQYIFALLSLILDREPIQLAFRALSTDDDDVRGTALEYLDNVLPDRVRDALWRYLGDHRAFRPPKRDRATLVQRLLGRGDAITSILEAMRNENRDPRTSPRSCSPERSTSRPKRASGT